jgi:cytochrome c oxidase assembly factor CtaG
MRRKTQRSLTIKREVLARSLRVQMSFPIQNALDSWTSPVPLNLVLLLDALIYLRGWLRLRSGSLRSSSLNVIPAWRAASFVLGLFLIWIALGSPLAALDEKFLTIHMTQHLLLMTFAPALILLGAPVMPLLHGLPQRFVRTVAGPLFRWTPLQRLGRAIAKPALCWLAASAALIGWHVPAAFSLGLESEAWHVIEHLCFLVAGFLFWWPVIQPWPSVSKRPRWSFLLYLFLATLPCDMLSGFLVFSGRVMYPIYLSARSQPSFSALEDQQAAGALMWTCITFAYLVPAVTLTMRLLEMRTPGEGYGAPSQARGMSVPQTDPQSVEVV